MEISQLIRELEGIKEQHGEIEVTCTHSVMEEGSAAFPTHYETTVENLIVNEPDEKVKFKRVRLWL